MALLCLKGLLYFTSVKVSSSSGPGCNRLGNRDMDVQTPNKIETKLPDKVQYYNTM